MPMDYKAGRELDALVAEKVFKLVVELNNEQSDPWITVTETENLLVPMMERSNNVGSPVSNYSTAIEYAWEVVEKIKERDREIFHLDFWDGKWTCGFEILNHDIMTDPVEADTAPLAICLAALKAVGVE